MPLITVKPGETKGLPKASVFLAGLGWEGKDGQDLDLWIFRHHTNGVVEAISWANGDWHRPDLGLNIDPVTRQENPWIATPELDVIHRGDDRTGRGSDSGYDELADFDLSKAPDSVIRYSIFGTIYDEKKQGLTLGMASNIVFGIKDEATNNELRTDPTQHDFDVSVALATIDRASSANHWTMSGVAADKRGTTDDMFKIAGALGVR